MSVRQEPTRTSPLESWAMLGEHPSQRVNELLAERLDFLAGIPHRRRRPIRRLVIRLQTAWSRPSVRHPLRDPLPGVARGSLGKPIGT
jgi:hypothetical protein